MTIYAIAKELRENKENVPYTATLVNSEKDIFLGIDSENRPSVFILVREQSTAPSIRTAQLKIEFSKKYKLSIKGTLKEERLFHAIHCLSKESPDVDAFMAIIDSMLNQPSFPTTVQAIRSLFNSLVNLFGIKISSDYINERKGLWAELFFMKENGGFKFWAPSWHSEPSRIFDFSMGNKRTEVKCTTNSERIHEFSHRQLISLPYERIAIVSLLLLEDDAGTSLKLLIGEAKDELLGTQDYVKLERAIRRAGMTSADEEGPRFNESFAIKNIAWFNSSEVPKFPIEEPQGVSGTHYKSDLSTAMHFSKEELRNWIEQWTDSEDDG